ncbi:tumor necrosis factor alpha-induced protein 2-like [Engraulis encrasicolus]|uniref:tumor necrosis factor alpha-induced protein 2-like n=1 Tax=Engraulis encrasicolus TaxID=184585 RepID=UPI002FD615CF
MADAPLHNGAPSGGTAGTSDTPETQKNKKRPSMAFNAVASVVSPVSNFVRSVSIRRSKTPKKDSQAPSRHQQTTPTTTVVRAGEETVSTQGDVEVAAGSKVKGQNGKVGSYSTSHRQKTSRPAIPDTFRPGAATGTGTDKSGDKSVLSRATSVRRSLKMKWDGPKKKDTATRPEVTPEVVEVTTEVKEERPKVRDSYNLPPPPTTAPSVMEVKSLIDSGDMLVALVNILFLREEWLQSQTSPEGASEGVTLTDLQLLYGALRDKMATIVRESSALPARNKELLVGVCRVVQEEERRERGGQAGGLGGWREAWREAVTCGVRQQLAAVHLDTPEHNTSWLAVHLGLLGKAIVEHLEQVKAELQNSYPPSFCIFHTYVEVWHQLVTEHLSRLVSGLNMEGSDQNTQGAGQNMQGAGPNTKLTSDQPKLQGKDFYALLNFIYNQYSGESIMGSDRLQPEMGVELKKLSANQELLETITDGFCTHTQAEVKRHLKGVLRVEKEELWERKATPKERHTHGHTLSPFPMDIARMVAELCKRAGDLSKELRQKIAHVCLEEIEIFTTNFVPEFLSCNRRLVSDSSDLLDQTLWIKYHTTYMNSFTALGEHMESYRSCSADHVTSLSQSLEGAERKLKESLLKQLISDIRPFSELLMTKRWLSEEQDFNQITTRVDQFYQLCTELSHTHLQAFVGKLHLVVCREYFRPLMTTTYSCKGRPHKNQRAAETLHTQWNALHTLFTDMGSEEAWLLPLGAYLSNILKQKSENNINEEILEPLITDYPDISERHLMAVLRFRGKWSPARVVIQQRFTKLNKTHKLGEDRNFFKLIQ